MFVSPGSALFVEACWPAQSGGVEFMLDRYEDAGGFSFTCESEDEVRAALVAAGAPPDRASAIAPDLWVALQQAAHEADG